MRHAVLLVLFALAACGGDRGALVDAGPTADTMLVPDGSTDAPVNDASGSDAATTLTFESVEETRRTDEVVFERVTYRSSGLRIVGQVCRPIRAGRFPLVLSNHGGFAGLGAEWNGGSCADFARAGFVALQSSYRGEDGSEGAIEVCAGEVDDVLALLEVGRALPYVDASRIAMVGVSHGGCITLQALPRASDVRVAVALVPAVDWADLYDFVTTASGTPTEMAAWRYLKELLEAVTGGTPATAPDAYESRSPNDNDALARSTVPLFIASGVEDVLVPVRQHCALADHLPDATLHHTLPGPESSAELPAECAGTLRAATTAPRPTWPRGRAIVLYAGLGHELEGPLRATAFDDMTRFLAARLTE